MAVVIFLVAFLTVLGTVLVTKVLVAFQAFVVVFLIDCTTGLINLLFIFLAVLTTGLMIFLLIVIGTVLVTKVLVAFQTFVDIFFTDCITGLINLLFNF